VQTEKLLIEERGDASHHNMLSGRVSEIVYQGESLRVFVTLDHGASLSLRQPSHYEACRRIPPVGERLSVSLHPEDTIVVAKTAD
jgi:putative spermidine/putrescine transport system ATP-binding protein